MAPIRTPNAISNPTSAMMSPNPVMIESIVFSTPSPTGQAEVSRNPTTNDTTGLNLKRTIITTTAMIATAVLTTIAVCDMEYGPSGRLALSGDGPARATSRCDATTHSYYEHIPTI